MKRVAFVLGVLGLVSGLAHGFSAPAPLDPAAKPALVYSQSEYGKEEVKVFVAYKRAGVWEREELVSAPYVAVEQVKGGKFLANTGASAKACQLVLSDFDLGSVTTVTTRMGHDPLRFPRAHDRFFNWPENNRAFIIQNEDGASDLEFLTVDYAQMGVERALLPKSLFGKDFSDQTHLKIAPNGAHIAFMEMVGAQPGNPRATVYRLQVYHFSNKSVTTVAENIVAIAGPNSPEPFAWPAFTWLDWEVVLFSTMTQTAGGTADYTFKTTHVHKDEVKDLFTQNMAMGSDGGELFRANPSSPITFRQRKGMAVTEYGLEPVAMALMPRATKEEVKLTAAEGAVTVETPTRLLFHGKEHWAGQTLSAVSASKKHIAFTLSSGPEVVDASRKAELLVSIDEGEVETVVESVYYVKPLAWVE